MDDLQLDLSAPVYGDESTFRERFDAAFDHERLNEGRMLFSWRAEDLYDREIARLKGLSGVELVNPYRYNVSEMRDGNRAGLSGSSFERFEQRRRKLAEQFPAAASEIGASEHTLASLYAEQRRVEGVSNDAIARSPSAIDVWLLSRLMGPIDAAAVLGGVAASVTDPVLAAQNFAGFGARTYQGIKGILWGATKAAAGNAGVTAAAQPFVQQWRADAGMEHGFGHALGAIVGSAAFGAIGDPVVRSGYRGVQALRGRAPVVDDGGFVIGYKTPEPGEQIRADAAAGSAVDVESAAAAPREDGPEAALDIVAQQHPEGTMLRRAADGDDAALIEVARASGAAEDPAVRGAIAELERYKLFGEKPDVPRADHVEALADMIRRVGDPEQPPGVAPDPVRPGAVDVAALPDDLKAAHQRLMDQQGSPIDMAAIMRAAPELVTSDLPLSDHKMRQARYLTALSDDAFRRVAAGDVAPPHAVLVARHIADKDQHAAAVDLLARSGVRSEAQAKMVLGELTAAAGKPGAHLARMGAASVVPERIGQRVKLLDAGIKALLKDARVVAEIEAMAARVEAALPEEKRGSKKVRADIGKRISDAVAEFGRGDTHVAELVSDAAAARQAGVSQKIVATALAGRIAAAIEHGGVDGLARPRRASNPNVRGISDPAGPEAQAQLQALEQRIKFRATDGGAPVQRQASLRDPSDLTVRGGRAWSEIKAGLDRIIARLPSGVRVEVADRLVYGGSAVDGSWDPYTAIVRIALGDDAERVLKHEEIHVLRDLGLLGDREFQVLVDRGIRDGAMEKYRIGERYDGPYGKRFADDQIALQAAMHEEMVAEMWADHRGGARLDGVAASALDAVTRFVERVRNAVRGLGFASADEIFRRIDTGDVGRRSQRQAPPRRSGGEKFALPQRPAGERPRQGQAELRRQFALPQGIADLIGVEARPVSFFPDQIVEKRAAHARDRGYAVHPEMRSPEAVAAFVHQVLGDPAYVMKGRDNGTWVVVRDLGGGRWGKVALSTLPDRHGAMRVKTAYVLSRDDHISAVAGAARQHGVDGFRYEGVPAAAEVVIADVSEASARGRDEKIDSTSAALRQRHAPPTEADARPGVQQLEWAETVKGLADLAGACKP